jgi:hypothetical protein
MATIQLPPDFKEFLQLLNSHGVEYLLVDLINKKASGRLKDLNDLENLP